MSAQERIRLRHIQTAAEGYLELGMPDHALAALDRLGDLSNYNSHALYLRGDALIWLGRVREAAECLEVASKIAPGNLHVWLSLGWCYKRIGRVDLAVAALEEAVAAEPSEAIAHYNLACYLSLAGDKTPALSHLARALRIDPNFRDQIAAEHDFDPLRSDLHFQMLAGALA